MSMTKFAAIAAGARTFQGKECKHGHSGERYTSSGSCVDCTKFRAALAMEKHQRAVKAGRGEV